MELSKEKQAEQARIIEGAEPCEDCGNLPHGIVQQRGVPGFGIIDTYEIGCLTDRDHRAVAVKREDAVKKWNAREFLPPKSAEGPARPKESEPLPS